MKLELEVLASVSIKRKKPWPRVVFLGEVQESLFLIDDELQRLSVLYVPSGKTKRKIPRLTPMLPNVVTLTTTNNGHFICGILNSGDLFLWHKDSDTIKYIRGLPEFRHKIASLKNNGDKPGHIPRPPFLHVSGDGTKLLLVLDLCHIYVWEMDPGQLFFRFRKGRLDKESHLQGGWTSVMTTLDTPLPEPFCKEVSLDACFFVSEGVYGLCCSLVYVYNRGDSLCVSSLLIKWFDAQNITNWSAPVFHSEWTSILYPLSSISPSTQPIPSRGAYLAKIAHDGQLVAIALNQACSHDNRMLFVSPWTDTVVVANMRGSGARVPVTANHRTYWVADMTWTYDDLFVACALKQGTLCFLTRLGEPALLQTFGCSIEMGPKPFMPLHPVISVRPPPTGHSLSASVEEMHDSRRQRFSVSSHPSLPLVVFSDGYMVSVVYLPGEPTCLSLMKGLALEATHHLRKVRDSQRVQISLFDSIKKKKKKTSSVHKSSAHRLGLTVDNNLAKKTRFSDGVRRYQFEEVPVEVLESQYDSDMDGESSPQIAGMDQGVLDFGDIGNLNTTLDYRQLNDWDEGLSLPELISRTQSALVLAWNLGASHTGLWTLDHEGVMEQVADGLVQLFAVLLHTKAKMLKKVGVLVSAILTKSQRKACPKKANKKLVVVLNLYKCLMHTLRLDGHSRHLMVCASRLTYASTRMLLSCQSLGLKEDKSKTLHGCYMLLQFAEAALSRIYTSIPNDLPWLNENGGTGGAGMIGGGQPDACMPAVFVYTARGRESEGGGESGDHDQTQVKARLQEEVSTEEGDGSVVPVELKGVQRLGIAWLVLYKAAVEGYQNVKQLKASDGDQATSTPNTGSKPKAEMRKIWSIIMLLQTKIHSLGLKLPLRNKFPLTEAEMKLVEGDDKKGEVLVVKELSSSPEPSIQGTRGCRLLLTMMYTLLGRGEVRAALEMVEFLIRQNDVKKAVEMSRQDPQTRTSLLSLIQQVPDEKRTLPATSVQNSAVRHTVQSMARLMAAYFCNKDMFLYPAHAPKKLPPLHVNINPDSRVLPLSRPDLTSQLTSQGLGSAWTSDKALEYLLLCGALPEAVWLASQLGDWKTAVMIGVAVTQHQGMCPLLYTKKNKLQLPDELHPQNIMNDKLVCVTGTPDQDNPEAVFEELGADLTPAAMGDFLLCASLCQLNFVPSLLESLTRRLKTVSKEFTALVPDSLYLPAPPVYCPQPTPTDESRIPRCVLAEIRLRNQVSSLVQSLLSVLTSAHCCLPAARWYVHQLMQAMATGQKLKRGGLDTGGGVDIRVLHDSFLSESSVFVGGEKDSDIHIVLESFRDLCSVVWMLHARDQLSRALRKKAYLRQKMLKRASDPSSDQWLSQCLTCLQWAGHLLPFSLHLNGADLELSSVFFSLVIELKADEQAARTLAGQFFESDSLHPEVQEKVQWLMREWKKVVIVRSKTQSLSLASYYSKACEKCEKVDKRRQRAFGAFDHKVFRVSDESRGSVEVDETLYIGSRPCESEQDFLGFVDEFYAVSFSKLLDEEAEGYGGGNPVPLLPRYHEEVIQRELYSDLHQAVTSFQKKQEYRDSLRTQVKNTSNVFSPRQEARKSEKVRQKKQAKQSLAKRGLFRSRSFSEIRAMSPSREAAIDFKPLVEGAGGKARSQEDLLGDGVIDLPPITPRGDVFNSSKMHSGSPHLKTSTPRRGHKGGVLKRSSSTTDLHSRASTESLTKSPPVGTATGPDPLASPVLQPWLLESMVFEDKYRKLECLLDWLNRWVSRNHAGQPDSPSKYSRQQSAIRIRVPPRMLLYSVWQLEHSYQQALRHQARTCHQPLGQHTSSNDKAMKSQQGWGSRMNSQAEGHRSGSPMGGPRRYREERTSPTRGEFESDRGRYYNSKPGIGSKPRGQSPSTREVDAKPRRTSPNRIESQLVTSSEHHPVLNGETGDTEKRKKGKKTKSGKKNKSSRNQLGEQWDIEISVPVEREETPRPLPDPPPSSILHQDNNNVHNSPRKKQVRINKDKSLDILLNERFVYDMNVNQNNGNNDEQPTEGESVMTVDTPRSTEAEDRQKNGGETGTGGSREAYEIGGVEGLTQAGERRGDNTNQNNSTGRRAEGMAGQERDIGRELGKLVANRIQQQSPSPKYPVGRTWWDSDPVRNSSQPGQSTDALISSLSEMIDEELQKTMVTLAKFDKKELEISSPMPLDLVDGPEDMPLLGASRPRPPPDSAHSTNTSFPHAEGGGLGGLTDRSMLSNNSTVAEEFRGIVRTELKKLIQAQHKGILTMLDSLEDQPDTPAKTAPAAGKSGGLAKGFDPFSPHDSKPALQAQECVILTAHQVEGRPAESVVSESRYEEDETLTPVSSLSGSEAYTDRTPFTDKPLSISQLKSPVTPPLKHKHPHHHHHNHKQHQVNGILKEMQDLSKTHYTGRTKHPHQHQLNNTQPFQPTQEPIIQPSHLHNNYTSPNPQGRPPHTQDHHHHTPNLLHHTPQGPPLLQHDHGSSQQPFSRLMGILRQFNSEVGLAQGTPTPHMPPLLRMGVQTEETQPGGVRFPYIPTQAWGEHSAPQMASGPPTHMPLLNSAPPGAGAERYEVPEKDGSGIDGGMHPPLLRAEWAEEPFTHMRDQQGVPRLIPPQQLLKYEQQKYNSQAANKRQLQAEIDEKMRATGTPPHRVGSRLLIPDVMEAFPEKDDRDHEARQRRRHIKLQKPEDRKARKSKEKAPKSARSERTEKGDSDLSDLEVTEDKEEPELSQRSAHQLSSRAATERKTREQNARLDEEGGRLQIDQGYALTPGLFDEYLSQEDQQRGQVQNNYASMQHHTDKVIEREKQKLRSNKKNVAVATDNTMDKSTTITKDTATNPVGEAISRYYRAKTGTNVGNILPPDIYMGLCFTDTHQGQEPVNNAFLNVVDIDSAAMLHEIAASVPEREAQDIQPHALDMQGTAVQPRPRMKSPHRTVAAPQELPTRDRSASPRRAAPDSVTVEVLGHPTHPGAPAAEIVSEYRQRTGANIRKRLVGMDQQFDAIATMTQNIEDDFKQTKVLLHTIEQMGEAIAPEEQVPQYSARSPHTPRRQGQVNTEPGLRPSFVKRANQGKEGEKEAQHTPVSSTPRLVGEDGLTVEERIKDIRSSLHTDGLRWSGITDVDDIIGDVIAKGDLDAAEFGFTPRDVEILTARTLRSAREGQDVSNQQLEEIYRQKSPRRLPKRTEAEQRKLQEFMERKKKERMREYRQQLDVLREKESKPFSGERAAVNMKDKELSEAEKLRLTNKQKREEDFSKERERAATQLMRDILEDKVPEQQPVINRTVTLKKQPTAGDTTKNTRQISPMGRTKTLKPASGQSPVRSTRKTGPSPDRAPSQRSRVPAQHQQAPAHRQNVPHPHRARPVHRGHGPVRKSLEFSGEDQIRVFGIEHEEEEDFQNTGPTEEEHNIQGMGLQPEEEEENKENRQPQKVYKPKPFTDIVKMQKPHVLRETRNKSHKPVPYVERLSEMSTASTWRSDRPSQTDQNTVPGSKRLKGAAKAKERTAQRVVKTYQERLHEMKQNRQYSTPIVQQPDPSSGPPRTTNPLQPPKKTVSRKSTPYSEQLKALQPPKQQYRTGVAYVRKGQQPVRRSHGPIHSPRTYSQQLQQLQPRTDTSMEYYDGRLYRVVGGSQRGAGRQRPYADPYSEAYPEEGDSALSPWSVEQDVRRLLYNGEDASIHTAGTDMDLSDEIALGADYEDYSRQVQPDQLEDVTLETASVMSFIDWDQVEDIIADVQ